MDSQQRSGATPPSTRAAYSDLFDRMSDCTFLIHAETFQILESNPAVELLLGFAPEQMLGKKLTDFVMPEHTDSFEKTLRMSRRRYHARTFEAQIRNAKGNGLIMEVNACVLRLSEQEIILQVIARDVTQVKEAERQLAALTITDEMTQLPNFRHFKSELQKEHQRSQRYGTQYSVVFCDIDHFKQFNDRNGHPAGDEVLKLFARVLTEACRNTDQPARYGGEEFVVLAPGVNWEGATILAERIRSSVEKCKFPHGEAQPLGKVTVSIGVASFPHNGATPDEVLKAADEGVYAAKKAGRNRVTSYAEVQAYEQADKNRKNGGQAQNFTKPQAESTVTPKPKVFPPQPPTHLPPPPGPKLVVPPPPPTLPVPMNVENPTPIADGFDIALEAVPPPPPKKPEASVKKLPPAPPSLTKKKSA